MIWHPQRGQRVELRYRKGPTREAHVLLGIGLAMKLHGCRGTVQRVALGRGPINVEVLLDPPETGQRLVVPRGNLIAIHESHEKEIP